MINIDALIKEASHNLHITKTKHNIKLSTEGKQSGNAHDLSDMLNEPNKIITIKPNSITIKLITEALPKQEPSLDALLDQLAKKVSKVASENGLTTEDCLNKIKDNL